MKIVVIGGTGRLGSQVVDKLRDHGDEAVAASPLFPMARNGLEIVGANVRTLTLSFDRGYALDPADLRAQLSEKTKFVSLASPQNPSALAQIDHLGRVLSPALFICGPRRVQIMQPAENFNQVTARLIEVFNGKRKLFDPVLSHGRLTLVSCGKRPPAVSSATARG